MMLNLAAWVSFDHHIAEIARLCSCHWRVLSCFCSSAVPTRCPLLPDSSLRHSQLLAVYIPQYTLRFAPKYSSTMAGLHPEDVDHTSLPPSELSRIDQRVANEAAARRVYYEGAAKWAIIVGTVGVTAHFAGNRFSQSYRKLYHQLKVCASLAAPCAVAVALL